MKMSLSKKVVFAAIGAVLAVSACKNSKYPGYEASEDGLYSKFYTHDEKGLKPVEGDVIRISLVVKTSTDSVLTDSKDPKFNRPGLTYYEFPLAKPEFKGSFETALTTMSLGDSASFMVSTDSLYKTRPIPPFLKKGTMLTYDVVLTKITPKAEADAIRNKKIEEQNKMLEARKNQEPIDMAKYIADNKITTKPTASGLYYIEKVKGKGAKPTKGCIVKVNYTGRFLDGKVFDTSDEATAKQANVYQDGRKYEPIDFPIGVGQVVPGWDEGIMLMSPGAKAQLIVPSALGYGSDGQRMPPYSPMVFDVELVSFTAADKAPMKETQVQH